MKRFLFSLVAIVVTSLCFAQDVIVQKDGSTIQAKVLKVSQSEIEYKKFDNLEGPTYTISTTDLQCINYANGKKDSFVSPNYNPNIVTNETVTQFSNDQQLLKFYSQSYLKKAKTAKIIGWISAGVLVAAGGVFIGEGAGDGAYVGIGTGFILAGAASWATCHFIGKNLEKKSKQSVQSSPIYQQEFIIGKNNHLLVGVDMLKDNTHKNQTLGLGLSYNF